MEQGGWIKLYRSLLDSPVWTSIKVPAHGCILLTLLLMASHSTYKGHLGNQEIEVQPGQIITSTQGICNRAGMGVTKENVRGALEKFEKLGFLTQVGTKTGRLITIVNWGTYQGVGVGTPSDVPTERPKDTHRQPIGCPTKQEDIKNIKNDKNNSSMRFAPPSLDEVKVYCSERHNNVDAQHFIDFYEAKGWMVGKNKMKDWKACVRTWERRDSGKNVQQSKNYNGREYSDEFLAGLYKEV